MPRNFDEQKNAKKNESTKDKKKRKDEGEEENNKAELLIYGRKKFSNQLKPRLGKAEKCLCFLVLNQGVVFL